MAGTRAGSRRGPSRGRPWWRRRPPLWVAVVAVALVGLVVFPLTRPDATERRVAELEAEADARDAEATRRLVAIALDAVAEVQRVFDETAAVLPDGDAAMSADAMASAAQVQAWREVVAQFPGELDTVGSAGTAVNVARNGLEDAANQLLLVFELYDVALGLPDDQAATLLPAVASARWAAVDSWNTAAIQLDEVSIEGGLGHSHVYVSGIPGEPAFDDGGD